MNTQNTNINQSDNIIKNSISKNEIIWVKYMIHNSDSDSNSDIIKYIITSDKNRTIYFLYEYSIKDNKYIKTNHQSNDPTKLEQKYIKLNFKSNSTLSSSSNSKSKSDSNTDTNTDIATNKAISSNSTNINTNTLNVINTSTNTGTRKRGRPKKESQNQDTNTLNTKVNNKTPNINSIKSNINKVNQVQGQNKKKGKLF